MRTVVQYAVPAVVSASAWLALIAAAHWLITAVRTRGRHRRPRKAKVAAAIQGGET